MIPVPDKGGATMGAKPATAEKHGVILIRMGVGREEYVLPDGATLADLLRVARIEKDGQEILIDGRLIEDLLVLQPGMIVTLAPSPVQVAPKSSWRNTVGMFPDDADFNAMVEAGRAYREADRQATLEELESDEE